MTDGWPTVRLGDCVVVNDDTYSPKEAWPFINYLDTGNITMNRIAEIQQLDAAVDKVPSRARRKVQPGDIVYSMVRPNQRHFGIIKDPPENFLASTGFAVLRGKEDIADTGFLYWYLAQDHIVEHLHTIAEHSTSAYPSIRPADLEQLELRLPPMGEQRRIAGVLGCLDDKIELNRRMAETLEQMARALFRSWFVDYEPVRAKQEGRWSPEQSLPGLPAHLYDSFPDRLAPSPLGPIPAGWQVAALGDVVELVGGGTPSTKRAEFWDGGEHCWATPRDLAALTSPVLLDTERKITDAGLARISSGLLPEGTLLMSSRAPIGYLAIASVPVAINQGFIAITAQEGMSNLFMLYWCRMFHEQIMTYANGSTFLEISKANFRQIPLAVPDAAVVESFDRVVRATTEQIAARARESQCIAAQRDVLLQRLISSPIWQPLSGAAR